MFGSGVTTLIISNEERNDIMKIVKSLEESGLLIKDVCQAIKNEAKKQKGRFLGMLLGTLVPHPLTNFEIQKYYQNEPKFNGVYSRNILPKIKDGTYVINPDEFKSIGTHWIALNVNTLIVLELNIFQMKLKNS